MDYKLNPSYVIDKEQNPKAVLLTIDEWMRVIEDLEELDDIRAYDVAKAGSQDIIPFEQAVQEMASRQQKSRKREVIRT